MTPKKEHLCPVFKDQPCPQGKEAADACTVRVSGNYDPMNDFKDLLLLHCALYRAEQDREANIVTENPED